MDTEDLLGMVPLVKLPTEACNWMAAIAVIDRLRLARLPDCIRTDNHPVIELTDVEGARPQWLRDHGG